MSLEEDIARVAKEMREKAVKDLLVWQELAKFAREQGGSLINPEVQERCRIIATTGCVPFEDAPGVRVSCRTGTFITKEDAPASDKDLTSLYSTALAGWLDPRWILNYFKKYLPVTD